MTPIRLLVLTAALAAISACEGGLLADKKPSPTLQPVPAATDKPDVSLVNTYWRLVELNGGPVLPGKDRELHMMMKSTDQLSGYAGCNQFTGALNVTDTSLAIGPVAATRMMCEGTMEQEREFLQALENASSYMISGEDLSVGDGHGAITMRFIAVYF